MQGNKQSDAAAHGVTRFYGDVIGVFHDYRIPFLIGGTCAVNAYTGLGRETKDLDIFCRSGDHIKIFEILRNEGFRIAILDERWLAKVTRRHYECDIIFGLANAMIPINDEWFNEKRTAMLAGIEAPLMSPTELIWSKAIVQGREKNDMPDIMHIMLAEHKTIDWKRLLSHMEQYWELLLTIILYFRFVYPSERERVPRWLLDELLSRLDHQMRLPTPKKRICRGRLVSRGDYEIDVRKWGFDDLTA